MELFGLGRKMTWSGPVIGIQARGLDGRDPPYETVEAMTDEYLAAVKTRQPQGPYFLCGYSFGGLVAFELARRLRERGDEVAFVGSIATLPPGHRFLRLWSWAAIFTGAWPGLSRRGRLMDNSPPASRRICARSRSAHCRRRPPTGPAHTPAN